MAETRHRISEILEEHGYDGLERGFIKCRRCGALAVRTVIGLADHQAEMLESVLLDDRIEVWHEGYEQAHKDSVAGRLWRREHRDIPYRLPERVE